MKNVVGYNMDLRFGLVMDKPEQFLYLLKHGWFVTVFLSDVFVAIGNSN